MIAKLLKRIKHGQHRHFWKNDNHYPTHGYHEIPYSDSYCDCGVTGAQYLAR